jgi:putative MATE family efflux protein
MLDKIIRKRPELVLTEGSIPKKMILFTLPILASGWLQFLFNVADLVVCGQFGSKNSVGAVSATTSLIYLIINLFLGLSVGANVVMGQAYGAKNTERGRRTIGSAMALALVSSLFLCVFGVSCSRYFLEWMDTPADIIDLSTVYMQIYFAGIPFMLVYNFGSALLRGMGDTRRPFYYLTISGAMNYGLNVLFVKVFQMDVAGVAWATFITQALAAIAVFITLIVNKGFASMRWKDLHFYKDETKEILRVGLPAGIQSAMYSISNVIIQSSINSFGSYADTGNGAGVSIENFVGVGMDSFCQAGIAFVSANYGAKKTDRISKSVFWSFLFAAIAAGLLGGLAIILRTYLIRIYTSDEQAIEVGTTRILILCGTYITFAVCDEIPGVERGLGYSTVPMIVSLIGICGLRLLYIFLIFQRIPEYHTLNWLYYTYPISWVITGLAHIICYFVIKPKAFAKCLNDNVAEKKPEDNPLAAETEKKA